MSLYTNNEQYLSASLNWLQLRLQALGGAEPSEELISQIDTASAARASIAAQEPTPHFVQLVRRFDLNAFESDILLLCLAMELDTRIPQLCTRAHGNPGRSYPTYALALALFDDPSWDALAPDRPLRYWRLIEIVRAAGEPLIAAGLGIDERVANYARGLHHLDARLAQMINQVDVDFAEEMLAAADREVANILARRIKNIDAFAAPAALPVVQLPGPYHGAKQLVAWTACRELGLRLCSLQSELIPVDLNDIDQLARLWQRECRLQPSALFIEDQAGQQRERAMWLRAFLSHCDGLVFVDQVESDHDLGRECLTFDVAGPAPAEQREFWQTHLGNNAEQHPSRLAGQFSPSLPQIRQTAACALSDAPQGGLPLGDALWNACRSQTRPRLDQLAQRIDAKANWDDLVLPKEETALLQQICQQVQSRNRVHDDWGFSRRLNRGLGISALFAGESGTGKTMAAEVIANDLCLDLVRIDLSGVVNKYIGETEKNLRRLFDAADHGGAILFFDEADALFGKRTDVKDSHDRYANIEVNYLLQRIEAYRGLAILATNLRRAIDAAFLRRLRFVVEFPVPDALHRQQLWQKAFPAETPLEPLDYRRLSRLKLTGGSIHNIALNAAFAAAAEGRVTMRHILQQAMAEFRKLQKPINAADFHWQPVERASA